MNDESREDMWMNHESVGKKTQESWITIMTNDSASTPDLNMFIAVLTKDTLICEALICGVLYEYELKAESFWKSDTIFGRLL